MKALRAHARGGADQLVYEDAPVPEPDPGHVLVAVHAAGITFTELLWDESWSRNGVDRTPIVPAHELSGTVVDLGPGVTEPAVGTEVYGLIPFDRDGAAAEYAVVPVSSLVDKPRCIPHEQAAAFPLAALTAWQALTLHARVRRGSTVLVQGGAGSVGGFAVQLASTLGATVTATCLAGDIDFVRSLGADDVRPPGGLPPRAYDVVLDTVSGQTLEDSYGLVHRGGTLVTLLVPPSQDRADRLGITAVFFVVSADRSQLGQIASMIDDGTLQVTVAQTFPLRDGRAAYQSGSRSPRLPGKTVLVVR
jgi:NADPH:quinone reductase-like Zn-dependent oxidoreductase